MQGIVSIGGVRFKFSENVSGARGDELLLHPSYGDLFVLRKRSLGSYARYNRIRTRFKIKG